MTAYPEDWHDDIKALVAELRQGARHSGVTGRVMLRAADAIKAQQAINAQLLEALNPFAECADFIGTHSLSMKDETGLWTPFSSRGEQPPGILVSHVRAARAAIKAATEG